MPGLCPPQTVIHYDADPASLGDLVRSLQLYERLLRTRRWLTRPVERIVRDGDILETMTWASATAMRNAALDRAARVIWANIRRSTRSIHMVSID